MCVCVCVCGVLWDLPKKTHVEAQKERGWQRLNTANQEGISMNIKDIVTFSHFMGYIGSVLTSCSMLICFVKTTSFIE